MIYRLGYVVGKFIYYVKLDFFSWLLLKYYVAPKRSVFVRNLSGCSLPLPERIPEADGKADQTDLYIIVIFGFDGNKRASLLAL